MGITCCSRVSVRSRWSPAASFMCSSRNPLRGIQEEVYIRFLFMSLFERDIFFPFHHVKSCTNSNQYYIAPQEPDFATVIYTNNFNLFNKSQWEYLLRNYMGR